MANGNVFTTKGKGLVTAALAAIGAFVAFGTGTTTPVVGDTTLGTELTTGTQAGYARVSGTISQQTITATNDTYQNQASITSAGTTVPLALTEAGNFDASTSGNIMLHSVFSAINLASGDTLTVKLQVQFT
jgi:hypothetical protein